MLGRIQNELFDLGADLATPGDDSRALCASCREQVERLEREIDAMNEDLEPLRSFILPGGGAGRAQLHLARAVARRAERTAVAVPRRASIRSRSPISTGCRTICSCSRVGWRAKRAGTSSGSRARRAAGDIRSPFVLASSAGGRR